MKAVQIVNPSEMKVVELEKPTVGVGEVFVHPDNMVMSLVAPFYS